MAAEDNGFSSGAVAFAFLAGAIIGSQLGGTDVIDCEQDPAACGM